MIRQDGRSGETAGRRAEQLAREALHELGTRRKSALDRPVPYRRRWGWVVAAACAGLVLARLPVLGRAFADPPTIRTGATDTDAATDRCIDRLWEVSAMLQARRANDPVPPDLLGFGLVEPTTTQPYVVTHEDDGYLVSCPNPETHGLRLLVVRESDPVPEARR